MSCEKDSKGVLEVVDNQHQYSEAAYMVNNLGFRKLTSCPVQDEVLVASGAKRGYFETYLGRNRATQEQFPLDRTD